MNRAKLEDWMVRLSMIRNRNRIPKGDKAEARRIMKIKVTKLQVGTLETWIAYYLTQLEAM